MRFLEYWKHVLFFGSYLAILLICMSPDISQKCFGNDSFSLLYGAKFLEVRYPAPLYTFVGWPIANLPFGIDGGNLILFLSVIPAFLSSICVFFIVKKNTVSKLAPWVGSASLMGCYVFFSQAIIIELYSLLALCAIASFLALTYGKYKTAAVLCGCAMASHYIVGMVPFVAFLIYSKEFRWICYIPVIVFLTIFLSYHTFLDRFVWELSDTSTTQLLGLRDDIMRMFEQGSYDRLGKTFWEGMSIVVISFGLAVISIMSFMKKAKRSYIFWIIIALPFGLILFGGYDRFVYVISFAPFFAVMAGMGVDHLSIKHLEKVILIGSIVMMLSMPLFFDIGNTLDENKTTARQMIDNLDNLEDGSIVIGMRLFEYSNGVKYGDSLGGNVAPLVEYYNRENNRNIIPAKISILYNLDYWKQREELERRGMVLPEAPTIRRLAGQSVEKWIQNIGQQISICNPDRDVYYYEIVDKETERCELIKVNLN